MDASTVMHSLLLTMLALITHPAHRPALARKTTEGFRCTDERNVALACLPESYSKFELPKKVGVNYISVSFEIDEVLRINDKDYSISFSSYLNVEWPDRRIHLHPEFGREQAPPGTNLTDNPNIMVPVNLEYVKDLWLPNIFIYNLKTYKVMDVLNKLAGLWILADRTVYYSQACHITFICAMRFDKFPLDTQTCKFQVGSYSYEDSKMVFITKMTGYVAPKRENSIALDYAITIERLAPEDSMFLGGAMGNFSLAGFQMVLHRYVSTYIITYYLPSGLFVIVSWISFLIPMDVIPGRMALLVTLFLVLVNIFNTVTTNTPKAEGLTAIEAWMLACILFVFGALIEYAAILFKKQRFVSSQHRTNVKIVCKNNLKYEVQPPNSMGGVTHHGGGGGGGGGGGMAGGAAFGNAYGPSSFRPHANNAAMNSHGGVGHAGGHYGVHMQHALANPALMHASNSAVATSAATAAAKNAAELRQLRVQQLAEEYWRIDKFFLISFPILFFIFNIIYWMSFIL